MQNYFMSPLDVIDFVKISDFQKDWLELRLVSAYLYLVANYDFTADQSRVFIYMTSHYTSYIFGKIQCLVLLICAIENADLEKQGSYQSCLKGDQWNL